MNLTGLQANIPGIVTKIKGRSIFRERMMKLGLLPGTEVYLGDPETDRNQIGIEVNGTRITLTMIEAGMIEIAAGDKSLDYTEEAAKAELAEKADKLSKQLDVLVIGNPGSDHHSLAHHTRFSQRKKTAGSIYKAKGTDDPEEPDGFEFKLNVLPETCSLFDLPSNKLNVCKQFFEESGSFLRSLLLLQQYRLFVPALQSLF